MVSSALSLLSEAVAEGGQGAAPTFGEQVSTYFQAMFKKIGEIEPSTWIVLVAMAALGIALLVVGSKKQKWNASAVAFAALALTLSFLLSNIRLARMPQGGSITAASMLPMMLFSYAFGLMPGLLAGMAYGVLEFLQAPVLLPISPIYAVCQVVLDYILAFGCTGLAALFASKHGEERIRLPLGIALASVLRFFCSMLSGVLFFAEYAGDQNPWIYSVIYNGSYMLPELLICVAVGIAIGPRLCRAMRTSAGLR